MLEIVFSDISAVIVVIRAAAWLGRLVDRPENQAQSSLVHDSHNSSSPRVDAVQQYAGFLTSVRFFPTLRFLV